MYRVFPENEPWEVEEDLSFAEIVARRRTTKPEDRIPQTRVMDHDPKYDLYEITHMRGLGLTDEQICNRLNMAQPQLNKRIRAAGLSRETDFADRRLRELVDKYIETGRPFTTSTFPMGSHETSCKLIVEEASNAGRILSIGTAMGDNGEQTLWQETSRARLTLAENGKAKKKKKASTAQFNA